jgi:hypothetical protein
MFSPRDMKVVATRAKHDASPPTLIHAGNLVFTLNAAHTPHSTLARSVIAGIKSRGEDPCVTPCVPAGAGASAARVKRFGMSKSVVKPTWLFSV